MKYKNARFRIIAAELEEKIQCGDFSRGERFLTRDEITEKYGISPVTAFRVLKILESDGMISCGRGHRALILTDRNVPEKLLPPYRKKIILLAGNEDDGTPDIELEWLISYLFNRMQNDGLSVEVIREKEYMTNLPEADGYMVLLEQEQSPQRYDFLRETGKPFCMLSRSKFRENTLLIMSYLCLSQMVLEFAADRIRKIHVIRGCTSPFDRLLTLSADVVLPIDLGIQVCGYGRFTLSHEEDMKRLSDLIETAENGEAFFCTNHILADHIQSELKRRKLRNVPMTWSAGLIERISAETVYGTASYPVIDLKIQETAQSLLVMLYRQFHSGNTHDPGMLLQPELSH